MDKILLAHGSGGRLSHELIKSYLLGYISNEILCKMDDSAVFSLDGRMAFTTDSFVVKPLFFPGGDIGRLAICGTVNDLATDRKSTRLNCLALIIEEGFPLEDLQKIMESIRNTAVEAGIKIVTGDTKVVNHGGADGLFINTSGIGVIPDNANLSGANARPGDKIIINGTLGDHGVAVMAARENLRFQIPVQSDCAPLNALVESIMEYVEYIHCLRDPTRGGLATTLNELAGQSGTGMVIYEEALPVKDAVRSACDMLGLDPVYVANEGKMVVIAAPEKAELILEAMKSHKYGRESAIIGEVTAKNPGRVIMKTLLGTSRIIDMLSGELLPRIC
jgi:hydrogenase expression/formation protein HypE